MAHAQAGSGRDGLARPRRPAQYADLTELIDAAGGAPDSSPSEIAAATAEVVVRRGRGAGSCEPFVTLGDRVGLETLGALWRAAEPASLPGALWALYLLRYWCRTDPDEVARLWRLGEPVAAADAVVVGVPGLADAAAMSAVADTVLERAFRGDFAVALERAAALFEVLAAGRRELGEPPATEGGSNALHHAAGADSLAAGNERAAAGLRAAARLWRAGSLS